LKLHLSQLGETKLFTAIEPDHVMVNGERFDGSVVVLPNEVRSDWKVAAFDDLNEAHFEYLLATQPEILLFGTGSKQQFAHPSLYRSLTNAGVGIEFMDTAAACRTYNILVAEDRKVIAAILL